MKSICASGLSDQLRLCSAIFDTLGSKGNLNGHTMRINYMKRERNPCLMKKIGEANGRFVETEVLRCSFIQKRTSSTLFYVLVDSYKIGAVFVLLAKDDDKLQLHARVTKIGSLLPVVDSQGKAQLRMEEDVDIKRGAKFRLNKRHMSEEGEATRTCSLEKLTDIETEAVEALEILSKDKSRRELNEKWRKL